MGPDLSLTRKLGMGIGILVVFVVGVVSLVTGRQSGSNTVNSALQNLTVQSDVPTSNLTQTPAVKSSTNTSQTYHDDSDEYEDEGGGSATNYTAPAQASVVSTQSSASAYKDGTYSTVAKYMSPGGPDQISVSITIAKNVVTAANVISGAGDNTSQIHQDRFISGYKPYVIGQPISTLNLSRVSGASLTTAAFDNALNQIRTQAKL